MATIKQTYKAHTKSINAGGNYTSIEVPYLVFDAVDEDEALSSILDQIPNSYNGLPLDNVEIDERKNDTTFAVNAIYRQSGTSSSSSAVEDDATMSFDCGGGTRHVSHAISYRLAYGTRDSGGAINWNGKTGAEMQIDGVDVPTAQLRETWTKVMRLSDITTAYKRKVAGLVGKVNLKPFKGWYMGEVMFLGMSFSSPDKSSLNVTVTYNFAIQLNETHAIINGVDIGSKWGFEYAWALPVATAESGNVPTPEIDAIYVNQVCTYVDFGMLGL